MASPPQKQPPPIATTATQGRILAKTKTEEFLDKILEPLDTLGKRLMGELWQTFYLSIQDAIALGLLLQIPGLIGKLIIGESFSSFNICLKSEPWAVNRYACFVIVASDFLLWIVLAGRILGRFFVDFWKLFPTKSGMKKP
jgi:hypothetical protein